jgi:hypothetical protein
VVDLESPNHMNISQCPKSEDDEVNVPGWTAPIPLSRVDETDSEALSTVDFWESGVTFSLTSAAYQLAQHSGLGG